MEGTRKMRVRSLGRENPLEKGMTTHSSILDWKIPWTEEPGRLQSMQLQRVGHDWAHKLACTNKETAMAPHSSTLAWKIPWTEEPGGLQSMGSLGVGHNWATSLSLFTFLHWRRKWQPTPVFLPGESQGWGSLVGCHLWGHRVRHDWSDLAAAAAATQANNLKYMQRSMHNDI